MLNILKRWSSNKRFKRMYVMFVYLQLCYGRLGSYIVIPKDVFDDIVRYGTFLLVLGFKEWKYVVPVVIVYVVFKLLFGHLDYRLGLPQLQTSINNSFNPDLMHIKRNVSKKKKNENKK